ncbi:MAG: hypothetical protein ACI8ZO_001061 [Flavobacteriales bacterium]|jgi:hypothetical protein
MGKKSQKEIFNDLRKRLEEQNDWPVVYMFKFIIPSDIKKFALVTALFGSDAEVYSKNSKKGNFTSITAKEVMLSADDVMHVYQRASQIEGIISL